MKVMDIFDVIFLLVAGILYHLVFPGIPIAGGMKPDVSLAILFILIIMKKDFRLILLSAVVLGIMTTVTSSLPEGAWINMVDKLVIVIIMYYFTGLLRERFRFNDTVIVFIVSFIGTIISGMVFAGLTAIFDVMPGTLLVMIQRVIIPSAILNIGATYVLEISFKFAYKTLEG